MRPKNACTGLERNQVLVLGDSHTRVFEEPAFGESFRLEFEVLSVRGASAYGLRNRRSITQAHTHFMEALANSEASNVVMLLGAVDTDFLIWHRAKLAARPIDSFFEESVSAYSGFLSEIAEQRTVTCVSAPLPTVADQQHGREAVNASKAVTATQAQRTALTRAFNRRIQAFCESKDIEYVMLDEKSVAKNGLVDRTLINENPVDHHYNFEVYAELLVNALETNWADFKRPKRFTLSQFLR